MSGPVRIQRKRTKGWRLPAGAVCVGRPSRWGNPILIGGPYQYRTPAGLVVTGVADTHAEAVAAHRVYLAHHPALCAEIRAKLAGRDLACWCPLVDRDGSPVPCHVDNVLIVANGRPADVEAWLHPPIPTERANTARAMYGGK